MPTTIARTAPLVVLVTLAFAPVVAAQSSPAAASHGAGQPAALLSLQGPQTTAKEGAAPDKADPGQPTTVTLGPLKNVRVSGLLQHWFAAGSGGFVDTFRLRRAEFGLSAGVDNRTSFTISVDPAKALSMNNKYAGPSGDAVVTEAGVNQASRILQNLYVTLRHVPGVQLDVGQFKVPLGFEGLASSAGLGAVERTLFVSDRARGGSYGDVRDIGVAARATLAEQVDLCGAVFNGLGQSQNDVDKDNRKAVAARVAWRPSALHGLHLGASAALDGGRGADVERRRVGVELRLAHGRWLLQSEYMRGRDGLLERRGFYLHAGRQITRSVEAVFRFDSWDPNVRREVEVADLVERDYVGGVNWSLGGNLRWQANYLRRAYGQRRAQSRHQLLTNLQLSW